MRTAFFYWPAAWASGHDSFQASLLDGLIDQDRHEIVVVVDEEADALTLPPPHSVVTYRRKRRRLSWVMVDDVATERAAARAVRRAGAKALIACANFPYPVVPEIPLLATLHETDFMEPAPWNWFPSRGLQQMRDATLRGLRSAAAVLANSAYTASKACSEYGVERRAAVVTAPAVRPFGDASEESPFLSPYVAQVGWFHPRKNVPLVLESWRRARAEGLTHDLVLIGRSGPPDWTRGSLGRQVLDLAGALSEHVHITGLVPRREYGRLLAHASALLVASHQEGFCVPVIEAFSVGTPVVAVARTALVEVAGPVGILVEPDVASFAAGILRAVSDVPDVVAMKAYAQQFTAAAQAAPALAVLDAIEAGAWTSDSSRVRQQS